MVILSAAILAAFVLFFFAPRAVRAFVKAMRARSAMRLFGEKRIALFVEGWSAPFTPAEVDTARHGVVVALHEEGNLARFLKALPYEGRLKADVACVGAYGDDQYNAFLTEEGL